MTGFPNIVSGRQKTSVEMSYVEEDVFNILLSNKFITTEGIWVQHPQLWGVFMRGVADGRV